jgi:hypothetical protein
VYFFRFLQQKPVCTFIFSPIRAVRPANLIVNVFCAMAETYTTLSWPPILKMLMNKKFSDISYEDHDIPKAQNRSGDLCYPLNASDCQIVR